MRGTHGILNPQAGAARFTLSRVAPAADLAPFVERFWLVRWDLRGRPPYAQETLSYPCVNLVIGTHRPGVFGPTTRRFTAELAGLGWVVGAKFRPGVFGAFTDLPAVALVDQSRQLGELFGAPGYALARAVHDEVDDAARIAHVEAFLRARAGRRSRPTRARPRPSWTWPRPSRRSRGSPISRAGPTCRCARSSACSGARSACRPRP